MARRRSSQSILAGINRQGHCRLIHGIYLLSTCLLRLPGKRPGPQLAVLLVWRWVYLKARHQLLHRGVGAGKDGLAIAAKECIELKKQKLFDAGFERIHIVDHLRSEKTYLSGRIADKRIADEQEPARRPMQGDLAWGLAGHRHDRERAKLRLRLQLIVDDRALGARMRSVGRVNGDASSRALAQQGADAGVVAVRQHDLLRLRCAQRLEYGRFGRHRINAQGSLGQLEEVPVEVIAVGR